MLICGHCGGLVKSLSDLAVHLRCEEKPQELVVVENTDVQQLQAKIAALIPGIVTSFTLCDEKQFIALTNELRQLSAV